ncbi:hypothetical protein [Costertonia aggregata]|uniref:Uncharacterized protein n=1 Tax=Costertonia aggregata TaxID=343403 RepID=A0A7H9AN21_9FLAO|nr:hypothetical protein [Costertonia aggregata]QLG44849.1 hypothetical protein HYG79_05610 [Costertonia aggregata]
MKRNLIIIIFLGFLFLISSCDNGLPNGPRIGPCSWTDREDITIDNVNLKLPSNLQSEFKSFYYPSGIIPDLTSAMQKGNTVSANKAEIKVTLMSSGQTCTGQNSEVFKAGSSRIKPFQINLKLPAGIRFFGSASMEIRSDDYKVKNDAFKKEFVMWIGTGNDPEFNGINGNIIGTAVVYDPSTGIIPIGNRPIFVGDDTIN